MDKIYNIEELASENGLRTYQVTIGNNVVEDAVTRELMKIAANVKLGGFRKGKAPIGMVGKMYFQGALEEVIPKLAESANEDIVKNLNEREKVVSVKTELVSYPYTSEEGKGELVYKLFLEMEPEVPELRCEEIQLVKKESAITDEDIEKEISRTLQEAIKFVKKEGTFAEEGDKVNIKYVGKIANKPFHGSSGMLKFIIGKNQVQKSIEDAVLGMKEGENKYSEDVTFPDNHENKVIAGRVIQLDIEVTELLKKAHFSSPEELSNEGDFSSYEDYKEQVRRSLEGQASDISNVLLKKQLFDIIDKDYVFDIPSALIESEKNAISETLQDEKDKDTLALRRVKLGMLLLKFRKTHNVNVDDSDILQRLQMEYGHNRRLLAQAIAGVRKDPNMAKAVEGRALEDKVFSAIVESVKVENKSLSFDELKEEFENV